MVGVYSATAAKNFGTVVYIDSSGEEFICTAIYDNKEDALSLYMWKDATIVSENLVQFVRSYIDNSLCLLR